MRKATGAEPRESLDDFCKRQRDRVRGRAVQGLRRYQERMILLTADTDEQLETRGQPQVEHRNNRIWGR